MKKYKCIKSFVAKGYIVEKGTVWVFDLLESFINVRLDSVDDDVYVEISYEAFSNKFEEVA